MKVKLGTCKVGDKVKFNNAEATVCLLHNNSINKLYVLVGLSEHVPFGWALSAWGWGNNIPDTLKSFPKGYWLSPDDLVEIISSVAVSVPISKPMGMFCADKICREFNDYGTPNTSEGIYLCYSCKKRPAYMRKI